MHERAYASQAGVTETSRMCCYLHELVNELFVGVLTAELSVHRFRTTASGTLTLKTDPL